MLVNKRLILVGGAGRNVGKTEFVCRLITKIAEEHDVYGLKVSAVFPDEEIFHGSHDDFSDRLFEETRFDTTKDTSRMLRAGAKKVFYLQSDDDFIKQGYLKFCGMIPKSAIIVCESNSLGYHVKPAKHILVKSLTGTMKPRAKKQLELVDVVITSDGKGGFAEVDELYKELSATLRT